MCGGVKQAMFSSKLRHVTLYLSGWEEESSTSLWRPDPTAGRCHLWVQPNISGTVGRRSLTLSDPTGDCWSSQPLPSAHRQVWTFACTPGRPYNARARSYVGTYCYVEWQGVSPLNSRMKKECMADPPEPMRWVCLRKKHSHFSSALTTFTDFTQLICPLQYLFELTARY